jgi:cytoskeletal protein CcmA (bactofilin family)
LSKEFSGVGPGAARGWEPKETLTTLLTAGNRIAAKFREECASTTNIRNHKQLEDLLIDGSVEGLIELDERKLTVGPTAKITADINARDVVVYGFVKENVHAKGGSRSKRTAR